MATAALAPMRVNAQTTEKPAADAPYRNAALPVIERVEDLLQRISLEEKVAQMVGIWEFKNNIQNAAEDFDPAKATTAFPHGLGQVSRPQDYRGVDVSQNGAAGSATEAVNRSAEQTATYVNAGQRWAVENTRLGLPMIYHEEALQGYVAHGATSFPQSIALASTWDPDLITRIFSVAAREMRARGAQLALAPVVDVARDPRWGRSVRPAPSNEDDLQTIPAFRRCRNTGDHAAGLVRRDRCARADSV